MFTGIITSIGTVISSKQEGDLTLAISCPWNDLRIGESISVSGACLTVTTWQQGSFTVQLSGETLARTAPRWNSGDKVNLERAMKLGDALDGHLVTGHVDGLARITAITPQGGSHLVQIEAPPALSRYIAEKGSVTLDGVSLTVNQVEGARFSVNIIPHTWQATTLGERKTGDVLNLEIDLIARYVERLLSSRA
ncbi:MAG: riboflavin synthase [Alphaproteobacteria bacterium]|nr:riboflavin synthase [Alphaproteobacteria bacterium]